MTLALSRPCRDGSVDLQEVKMYSLVNGTGAQAVLLTLTLTALVAVSRFPLQLPPASFNSCGGLPASYALCLVSCVLLPVSCVLSSSDSVLYRCTMFSQQHCGYSLPDSHSPDSLIAHP